MNKKKCPYCAITDCIKKGFQKGIRRWYCKQCKKYFQANKKVLPSKEELFCLYAFNKQTLKEMAQLYRIETNKLQHLFDEVAIPKKKHFPRSLSLCVDTTYFENFALVLFRDQKTRENLWWKFVEKELCIHYQEGRLALEKMGYTFRSVTADGLPGLPAVFMGIPFQYCHFHAKQNVIKYLTKKPRTDAGTELKFIMENIKVYNHQSFLKELRCWAKKYEYFLKERTYHPDGRWSYTHRRVRSALRSLWKMSKYLFTYQQYDFFMPVTTNTLESHFGHVKVRVGVHRGLSLERKQKLIHLIVLNSTVSYTKNIHKIFF